MPRRHYIIYCDESDKKGRFFSNFYGGVLLEASERASIDRLLLNKKDELGLREEIKWQYVDEQRADRYVEFIKYYFEFVATARLRMRIMFTQNMRVPRGLTRLHTDNQYFILYYQFLKHAFGIAHCNPNVLDRVYFQILPDRLPKKKDEVALFKNFLSRVTQSRLLRYRKLHIPKEDITDVNSEDHTILQGLDLVLGSINARLNDKLKEKPPGERTRGKRTRAKERVYKEINKCIRSIYPNFNIGVSTACHNGSIDRWTQPYRHWLFMPTNYKLDRRLGKRRPQ